MSSLDQRLSPCNPEAITACLARGGLAPMTAEDVAVAGTLARDALDGALAGADTFAAVQAASRCTAFVHREAGRLTGALAIVPLRAAGRAALDADRFDSLAVDLDLVARPGDPLAAIYSWGIVGATRRAKAAVLGGLARLRGDLLADIPFYCRAASDDGERVILGRLGYRPQPGSTSQLYVSPALAPLRSAA